MKIFLLYITKLAIELFVVFVVGGVVIMSSLFATEVFLQIKAKSRLKKASRRLIR